MAKAKKKPATKSGWVGGSFKAAIGLYLKKKAKKATKGAAKDLKKGLRQAIWRK